MATPMDNLMRLLVPNRTPPSGTAMPAMAPLAVAPQPAAPVAPQLSPTAKYIQDMQALMSGGIGQLSTGEKISAVGQVLQAAGSRGAADPAAVLQNVRQQQMQKLNAQYQIEQMQQKQRQEQQKSAFINQYAEKMPEELRGLLANADLDTAFDIVKSRVAGNTQLFQILDGPEGNKVAVYSNQSGELSLVDTPIPNAVETAVVDQGVKKTLINKNTGEVIDEFNVNDLTPARVARLNKAPAGRGGGRSGSSSLSQPTVKMVNGKATYVQWDKNKQKYVPFIQAGLTPSTKAPSVADAFTEVLKPKTGEPVFRK
jgi:hypothetical protein